MSHTQRISDPETLKAFAHPVRQRLYRVLAYVGPATNAMLGRELGGADPGLLSYHLRELQRRGFVEDVPELARDRRERWWRLVPGATSWSWQDFVSPEGRAVAGRVKRDMITHEFERLRHFEQTRRSWPPDWQQAATSSDSFLRLTPDELRELVGELHATLRRWSEHGRRTTLARRRANAAPPGAANDDDQPAAPAGAPAGDPAGASAGEPAEADRQPVFVFLHAFPERDL
ncbi:helix-turn-helix domain-containing protein [Plantactinospora siamensis]|uniref:Helix-turn-helix domain-containing protein n=1 Tax=Plantactinospora siamensis TaxID=555372 RepID=A0ABV6NVZ3_9ACTN